MVTAMANARPKKKLLLSFVFTATLHSGVRRIFLVVAAEPGQVQAAKPGTLQEEIVGTLYFPCLIT